MSDTSEAKAEQTVLQAAFVAAEDDPAAASARAQAQQDAQAQATRDEDEKPATKGDETAADDSRPKEKPLWFMVGAGHGVTHDNHEIDFTFDPKKGPRPEQLRRAIELAMEKGWTQLYVYDRKGKPAPEMAEILNKTIEEMGLAGRIHCCTEPEKMAPTLSEMKQNLHGAAQVALTAVAVAVAAAAAQRLLQNFAPR